MGLFGGVLRGYLGGLGLSGKVFLFDMFPMILQAATARVWAPTALSTVPTAPRGVTGRWLWRAPQTSVVLALLAGLAPKLGQLSRWCASRGSWANK